MSKRAKLPVLHAVTRSYTVLCHEFATFLRAAGVWAAVAFTAVVGIEIGGIFVLGVGPPVTTFLSLCLMTVAASAVAVTWHRFLLLREEPGRWLWHGRKAVRTILLAAGLAGAWLVCALVALAILPRLGASLVVTNLGLAGTAAALGLVAARAALAFPAAAIGESRMTLLASWKFTVGNSWRLFWGLLLALVPLLAATTHLRGALDSLAPTSLVLAVLLEFLSVAALFVSVGLAAGFLSMAYRHFVAGEDGLPAATTPRNPESYFT